MHGWITLPPLAFIADLALSEALKEHEFSDNDAVKNLFAHDFESIQEISPIRVHIYSLNGGIAL